MRLPKLIAAKGPAKVVIMAAVLLFSLLAVPVSAQAATGYVIQAYSPQFCLGVHGSSEVSGALVVAGNCSLDSSQTWYAIKSVQLSQGTYYQYKNGHSGLCLGVQDASASAGAHLVQQNCAGTSGHSQFWHNDYQPGLGGDFFYYFVNGHSGKCMTAASEYVSGGDVVQATCSANSAPQTWNTA